MIKKPAMLLIVNCLVPSSSPGAKGYKNMTAWSTLKRKQGKWEDGDARYFEVTHLRHNQIAGGGYCNPILSYTWRLAKKWASLGYSRENLSCSYSWQGSQIDVQYWIRDTNQWRGQSGFSCFGGWTGWRVAAVAQPLMVEYEAEAVGVFRCSCSPVSLTAIGQSTGRNNAQRTRWIHVC